MKPSYICGSEYQPHDDGGFVKNHKDDSLLNNQSKGLFNRIRDTEYQPNQMIDRSSHVFMSTANMNVAHHNNLENSADKKSDQNRTNKSQASILEDTESKNKKYFVDDDNDDELV